MTEFESALRKYSRYTKESWNGLTPEYRERLFSNAEKILGNKNPLRNFTTLDEVRDLSNAARRLKHRRDQAAKEKHFRDDDDDRDPRDFKSINKNNGGLRDFKSINKNDDKDPDPSDSVILKMIKEYRLEIDRLCTELNEFTLEFEGLQEAHRNLKVKHKETCEENANLKKKLAMAEYQLKKLVNK
jgi:hypothetical protein